MDASITAIIEGLLIFSKCCNSPVVDGRCSDCGDLSINNYPICPDCLTELKAGHTCLPALGINSRFKNSKNYCPECGGKTENYHCNCKEIERL